MTLAPLEQASTAIQIHVATVLPAFLLGTWLIFFSGKGQPWHRTMGWIYLTLMMATATAAIFVHAVVGPTWHGFGLIHLLVPVVYFGVYNAIRGAQLHDIPRHRSAMLGVYIGGLLIAGGLTLIPGRIMNAVLFT